ncbi:MAG: helix-turn-helix transcriptional regulator [Clostridia bacterium]|nr:helix-turn-helix transcriptional regulator [Clostridia bacterium]
MKRKNLVKLRVELGLKSKDMAEQLGIGRVHYSNIENGKVDPAFGLIEKLEALCTEKGIEVDDIWELFKKES